MNLTQRRKDAMAKRKIKRGQESESIFILKIFTPLRLCAFAVKFFQNAKAPSLLISLTFCFSAGVFAQEAQTVQPTPTPAVQSTKPAWVDAIETTLKQNETWKLDRKSERSARDYDEYNFELKSGKLLTNIQIQILKDATGIEKRFAETIENLTNGMGRFSTRTKLTDLGDEAFKWVNVNKNGWTMIRFRKANVFVEIFSLSEESAPVFAREVDGHLPREEPTLNP